MRATIGAFLLVLCVTFAAAMAGGAALAWTGQAFQDDDDLAIFGWYSAFLSLATGAAGLLLRPLLAAARGRAAIAVVAGLLVGAAMTGAMSWSQSWWFAGRGAWVAACWVIGGAAGMLALCPLAPGAPGPGRRADRVVAAAALAGLVVLLVWPPARALFAPVPVATVRFELPAGFRGPFYLELDEHGADPQPSAKVVTYRIPATGVLKVAGFAPMHEWHNTFAAFSDGTELATDSRPAAGSHGDRVVCWDLGLQDESLLIQFVGTQAEMEAFRSRARNGRLPAPAAPPDTRPD